MKRTFCRFRQHLTVQKNEHAVITISRQEKKNDESMYVVFVCHKIKFLNMLSYRIIQQERKRKKRSFVFFMI